MLCPFQTCTRADAAPFSLPLLRFWVVGCVKKIARYIGGWNMEHVPSSNSKVLFCFPMAVLLLWVLGPLENRTSKCLLFQCVWHSPVRYSSSQFILNSMDFDINFYCPINIKMLILSYFYQSLKYMSQPYYLYSTTCYPYSCVIISC